MRRADISPNLQAVVSPCKTSNLNDENDCAQNEHCSCVKCLFQTYSPFHKECPACIRQPHVGQAILRPSDWPGQGEITMKQMLSCEGPAWNV